MNKMGSFMSLNERQKLFIDLMNEYKCYKNGVTILKKNIGIAIGLTRKEVDDALEGLTFSGKRSHKYIIPEVAKKIDEYMIRNTEQEISKTKSEERYRTKHRYHKTALNDKTSELKIKNENSNEYWKIPA